MCGIAVAIGGFVGGGFALRAFGSVEQLEIAFTSLLKSESKALDMVKQLTGFTAKTPFQLEDVGAAGKMLLSFGVAGDDLLDRLQLLGDIASGANVPLNEMAAIYGKTVSKGKAQTEELNQMSERGVPIIQALVDLHKDLGYEISKQDVYDAGRGRQNHRSEHRGCDARDDGRGRSILQPDEAPVRESVRAPVDREGQHFSLVA